MGSHYTSSVFRKIVFVSNKRWWSLDMIGTLVKFLFASSKCWWSLAMVGTLVKFLIPQTSAGIVSHDQYFSNLEFPFKGSV